MVGGFNGVEILLEFVSDGGITVRVFGFLQPCIWDKRNHTVSFEKVSASRFRGCVGENDKNKTPTAIGQSNK